VTEQFAFVDESLRPGRYLLGCVIVEATVAGPMRRNVRKLLLPNERRLHIRKSDRPQRLRILSTVAGWNLDARVYECRHRETVGAEEARQLGVERLVRDLQATGIDTTVYIERREGADDRDRSTIIRARQRRPPLDFHHLRPPDDPLLWLPDCIAWAVGAGGEWSQGLGDSVTVIEVG
jgi:hypothetical protein